MNAPAAQAAAPEQDNLLKAALMRCKRAFNYVMVFSFAINVLMLAIPLYSLQVLDRVMSSHSMMTLLMLTILIMAVIIFYGIFSTVRTALLNRIGQWLDATLAPELLAIAVRRSSIGAATSAGQQHRDLNMFKSFIVGQGITTLFDAPWSIIYIMVLYAINPYMGFLTVCGAVILLIFAVVTEYTTKKPLDTANRIAIRSMSIADIASRNAEAIEAMGMMPAIVENWKRHNQKNSDLQQVVNHRANVIQSMSRVVRLFLQIGVTCMGGWLALHGELTVGGMIAGSILASRALAPFEAAIGVWKSFVSARDSYRRLTQTITQTPMLRGAMQLPAPQGHLSVETLFYKPANVEKPIIKAVSFQLAPGESLGIIGPSAAGKSTLAKLIIGVLPPTAGTVRLDGAETFKWNRESLGPHVGYMPQDVELFNGTVRDNIARMQADASDEDVITAAKLAGAHEMILRLPKGYETEFAISNLSLSPGQRQRIGLARALFGKPRFIVLDEPNSNLDGDGERALINALQEIKKLRITTIVVAHRPSIVASIDKLMMLRDGAIEDFGARDAVLRKYAAPASLPQAPQQPQQGTGT